MQKIASISFIILTIVLLTNCRAMKVRKLSSIEEVEGLKKGALLVRLKTSENKITKLREIGLEKEANKVKNEQAEENKNIIKAFKDHFNFCPVYFFMSNQSNNVRSNELTNIFINENLETADTIQFIGDYLTAEFSRTQGVPGKDENGNRVATSSSYGLPSLIVMDKNFVQMSNPFPSAIRTAMFNDPIVKIKAVKSLNEELFYFFYEGKRWKAKKMLIEY